MTKRHWIGYDTMAEDIRRVRDGYGANWDPNLFRALDDVTRELFDRLSEPEYSECLRIAGVADTSIRRRTSTPARRLHPRKGGRNYDYT